MLHTNCSVHGCRNKGSPRHRLPSPRIRLGSKKNPQQIHNSNLIYYVHFRDENRASNKVLKKNAMPPLFLPLPTVERRENFSDHEYWSSMAETTAVTLDCDGVDRSTCNMSNKSKLGEAMVWESFRVTTTSMPTSRDCWKTAV
ncbi:hypothetical protein Trydic_g11816 [Trypoxylus dichotomus]